MSARILRKYHQLQQLYRAGGLTRVMIRLARDLLTSVYHYQMQYITSRRLDRDVVDDLANQTRERLKIECLVVESTEAFQAVKDEIPSSMRDSVDDLNRRLAQGCIITLARKPKDEGGGKEVIGYSIAERGVFSALGRRGKVSPDVLFGHYVEILPQYRGQRIHILITTARDTHCLKYGLKKNCGVISPQNYPSLRSSRRRGSRIVGIVQRVSVLRGLFVWETPWERIQETVDGGEPAVSLPSGSPSPDYKAAPPL
ncbi:MAG: hypothetical protein AB1671_14810 [Thermodesulfobacteriota bacterium]